MTAYTRHFVKAFSSSVMFTIFASATAYALRLLLARTLTPAEFGLVYAVFGVFGLGAVLATLGLDDALVKHVAELRLKKRLSAIKYTVLFTLALKLCGAFVLASAGFLLAPWLAAHYFNVPQAITMVRWYALFIALSPFYIVALALCRAYQYPQFAAVGDFIKNAVVFLFTALFLLWGFGALSPIIAFLFVPIVAIVTLLLWWIPRFFPSFFTSRIAHDAGLRHSILTFGWHMILVQVAGMVIAYTDTTLLTAFRPLEEVGFYNAAMPTARVLWMIGTSLALVLFPLATELWATRRNYLSQGIAQVHKYALLIVMPIAGILVVFPELLLRLLFGEAYLPAASVLRILAIAALFFTLAQVNTSVLAGIGKQKTANRIVWAGAIVNAAVDWFIIPRFGINGAGFATLGAFATICALGFGSLRKSINLKMRWSAITKTIIAAGLSIGLLYSFRIVPALSFYAKVFIAVPLSLCLYVLLVWRMGALDITEIKEILARVRKRKT